MRNIYPGPMTSWCSKPRGTTPGLSPQSKNRMATVTLWRTFLHDGKINPAWWGWGGARPPLSQYQPSRTNFWCILHTAKNQKQIFPEKELRGHSPNFHIHVSVSDLCFPTTDLPILLQKICGPILGIYKSLTDTHCKKSRRTFRCPFEDYLPEIE